MAKGMIPEFKTSAIVGVSTHWILIGFLHELYFSKTSHVNNTVCTLLNAFISMFMVSPLNSVNSRIYHK